MTAHARLAHQAVTAPRASPVEVVAHLGAVQAQDRTSALWAVALRTRDATAADVEADLARGALLRTHVFRGTWQLVTPSDLPWMLDLVGPRVLAGAARRYEQLGLDAKTLARATKAIARAVEGAALTREQLTDALARAKVPTDGGRLSHVLAHAELTKVITSGPIRGKQTTHAAFDERVPRRAAHPDDPIAELARRYLDSRGPATVQDLAWWSGLPIQELRAAAARAGLDFDREAPPSPATAKAVHLLPAFDEFFIAYQDRAAILDPDDHRDINAGGGMIRPLLVVDGRIVGTWSRRLTASALHVTVAPFRPLPKRRARALEAAGDRLAHVVGRPVVLD